MNLIEEQRVCVKFCSKLGKTATETHNLLKIAYGEEAMKRTTCHTWFRRFKKGRTSVKDDDKPGRPCTVTTDKNIGKIREMLSENPKLTVREIARGLGISYGSCHNTLHKYRDVVEPSPKRPRFKEDFDVKRLSGDFVHETVVYVECVLRQLKTLPRVVCDPLLKEIVSLVETKGFCVGSRENGWVCEEDGFVKREVEVQECEIKEEVVDNDE